MSANVSYIHAQIRSRVDSAITAALRADLVAVETLLDTLAAGSAVERAAGSAGDSIAVSVVEPEAESAPRSTSRPLDPYTLDFLREARRLVLACGAALISVLGAHKPGPGPYGAEICRSCRTAQCRTLPRVAEVLAAYAMCPIAIDRAEAWRRADAWFAHDGRQVPLQVEEFDGGFAARPAVPVPPESMALIVVDRRTGALSRWPDMPLTEVAREYPNLRQGSSLD